ncbi:dTMP kinase [Luedemannella flava]|uniref:Thymidylate kinase n=1 Tax=Luedemannella flava TaxID=349316 RepID=A0ABN2M7C5_9ACTN
MLGVASLGDWLGLLATSIFASQQVENPAAKGAAFGGVIAVRLLPALVLGPIAGVLADRFDRRYTMVVCDLIRFVFLLSIPLFSVMSDNGALVIAWISIATFLVEAVTMAWLPAKDAAVPNLLTRTQLETANQLTLATTYGVTPVLGALLLAGFTKALAGVHVATGQSFLDPTTFSLYFLAFTRLATAGVVFFGIREISGHGSRRGEKAPGVFREFVDGWKYVGGTPLVRGLVLGILAAFAGGGMVVGAANFYAISLGGGESTFYILFAMIFVGLAVGIVAGPKLIGALSRRRWFGMSIVLAGISTGLLTFAWHLSVAIVFVLFVGVAAGMAFLAGTTLLGGEVADEVRGRVFAFVNMATRVVLMLAISLSSVLVGLGSVRKINIFGYGFDLSTTRILLLASGVVGVLAGVAAFRQMDDKPGVPVWRDLIGSLRGRPLGVPEPAHGRGLFVVFEGGEGAGKSTQVGLLAEALRGEGRAVLVTREPGATDVGVRIRELVLDPTATGGPAGATLGPRAEALLYAADRAHHVASLVRPALTRGEVVISDRYVDSSLAYQGAGRTLPVDEVAWLSDWATGGLVPDLVVLLDVEPVVGLARAGSRGGSADRLESEALPFHERVRTGFLRRAGADPARYLVVDATGAPDDIAERILDRVRRLLPPVPAGSADERGPHGAAQPTPGVAEPAPDAVAPTPDGVGPAPDAAGQAPGAAVPVRDAGEPGRDAANGRVVAVPGVAFDSGAARP